MRLTEFLRELLPEAGIYYAATWVASEKYPRGGYWKNKACREIGDLAPELNHLSNQKKDAYMALAGYSEASYIDENGKWRTRTQHNAAHARSTWLDLDCGPTKPYPSKRAAREALAQFTQTCALPHPTHIVSSGNGLHVYWAFTQDVQKRHWDRFAQALKVLAKHHGLHADPSRTADIASVLRPIGTLNYKDPDAPKEVRLIEHRPPIGFKSWAKLLAKALAEGKVQVTRATQARGKNAALTDASRAYPVSDAEQLADRCATLREMRATLGASQEEPLWHACLGVLLFTQQGEDICHEWSAGYSGYSQEICQEKIDEIKSRQSGCTLCERMRSLEGNACEGCTVGRNSPISLGYPDAPQAATDGGGQPLPAIPEAMQENWFYQPGRGLHHVQRLTQEQRDTGQVPETKRIARQFLILDYCYRDLTGEFMARIKAMARPGEWVEADIPVSAISSTAQTLATWLGRAGVTGNAEGLRHYMQTWYELQRAEYAPQTMRRKFGWQEDGEGFVVGSDIYHPDGTMATVTLSKEVARYAAGHVVAGDLETQVDLINRLYNRPGMEARQFILAASLGSALLPLLHPDPIGVPIMLWEPSGGRGKTTVCRLAVGFWGNPNAAGQDTHATRTTEFAMYALAGMRRHLPILIDETTMWNEGKQVGKFAYAYSSGKAKVLGSPDGGIKDTSDQNWQNFLFLTGNTSLTGVMQATMPNSGPQMARIFEIYCDEVPLKVAEDGHAIDELSRNYGHIGRKFIEYVVPRQDKIKLLLDKEMDRLVKHVDGESDSRFWRKTAACAIIAAHIGKALGLLHFSPKMLSIWTDRQIKLMRGEHQEAEATADELLARLFNDLHGRILVTDKVGGKGHPANICRDFPPPRNQELLGRYAYQQHALWITTAAIKAWSIENAVDYKDLKDKLKAAGALLDTACRIYLTRGTTLGTVAQSRCWYIKVPDLDLVSVAPPKEDKENVDTGDDGANIANTTN